MSLYRCAPSTELQRRWGGLEEFGLDSEELPVSRLFDRPEYHFAVITSWDVVDPTKDDQFRVGNPLRHESRIAGMPPTGADAVAPIDARCRI